MSEQSPAPTRERSAIPKNPGRHELGMRATLLFPDREIVVVDLLVPAGRDPQHAVDVFARKFGVAEARPGRTTDRG